MSLVSCPPSSATATTHRRKVAHKTQVVLKLLLLALSCKTETCEKEIVTKTHPPPSLHDRSRRLALTVQNRSPRCFTVAPSAALWSSPRLPCDPGGADLPPPRWSYLVRRTGEGKKKDRGQMRTRSSMNARAGASYPPWPVARRAEPRARSAACSLPLRHWQCHGEGQRRVHSFSVSVSLALCSEATGRPLITSQPLFSSRKKRVSWVWDSRAARQQHKQA